MLRWLLTFIKAVVVLGAIGAAVCGRVIVAGEREIAESTAGLRAGDPHRAALHARRAAGFYLPGAPHVRVAYERLIALAATAEQLGNTEVALFAWRGVRTAAIETRWWLTPHADDLDRANHAIARLSAREPRPLGARTELATKIERDALDALARDEQPRAAWIGVLLLGFVAWIVGGAWAVRRGVTKTGQMTWSNARLGALACAAGIALYALSVWRA